MNGPALEEIAVKGLSRILIVAAAMLAGSGGGWAQDYPNRNITLIVPFAPGGATDILARTLAPHLAAKLGQTVVVENISGGGASIGPSRVARAAPDGYTLLIHNLAISAMGSLNPKLPFDVEKDLAPIAFVNNNPIVLIGRPSLPARTLPELIAWMKSTPAKMAHVGVGSTAHLSNTLFAQAIGASVDHIPYRGTGPDQVRHGERFWHQLEGALWRTARCAEPGAGGGPEARNPVLARAVRAGRHAEADRRQAQRRCAEHIGRSGRRATLGRHRRRRLSERAAQPGSRANDAARGDQALG
jgi:hypothetical protein